MKAKIGIISDTHDILRPQVAAILRECDAIVHAGDLTTEALLDELCLLGKVYVVHGNNDWSLMRRLKRVLHFEIAGIRFVMAHEKRDIPIPIPDVDVVVFGHTHQYFAERMDGRLWLNPGGCGRRRFAQELTMAVLYVEDGRIQVEKIELDNR